MYWLPRLIDKARACLGGTLGDYLYGQSPMDRGLLRELRLSHREFAEIVAAAPDDGAVVAAIAARDPAAIDRARAWSERLPSEHRLFFWFIDVDDGYRAGGWLVEPVRVACRGISRAAKRLWPRSYGAAR
ncbi:MAG: DUF5069 domain-containing protein [Candidatus Eremiobacteraeota bacterium]|nr:DUF5069 domain-containing protein [Candidatus Eremiobacteraeota bacterium]